MTTQQNNDYRSHGESWLGKEKNGGMKKSQLEGGGTYKLFKQRRGGSLVKTFLSFLLWSSLLRSVRFKSHTCSGLNHALKMRNLVTDSHTHQLRKSWRVGNIVLTLIFPSLLPRHTAALNCHRTSLATVTPFRAFQVLMSCGEAKRRKELREIPLIPKPPSRDFSLKSIRQRITQGWGWYRYINIVSESGR